MRDKVGTKSTVVHDPFYLDALNKLDISIDTSDKPLSISEKTHQAVIERVAAFYCALLEGEQTAKPVFRADGEWKNYNEEREFFYSALSDLDYAKADTLLKSFWRNRLGLIVKEYAKFESFENEETEVVEAFRRSIGRNYLIWKDLLGLPASRLRLKAHVGNPWGCRIDGELVTPKATRFHTNAMQIRDLLADCEGKVVAEIGGGYGGLAHYLIGEIGGLTYIDFDLPQTLVLAAYYLLLNYPERRFLLFGEGEIDYSKVGDYDVVLLPNYVIQAVPEKSVDVFFNSFSLSEMPPKTNEAYLNDIARLTRSYFLHNNMDRKGVINRGSERIPASEYPIDPQRFALLSKHYDLFHAHHGDYKEFLYRVLPQP